MTGKVKARGRRIPISAAREISKKYGYDQVVVLARVVGDPGVEWVTTYGRDRSHCDAAAKIGRALGGLIEGRFQLAPKTDSAADVAAYMDEVKPR